VKKKKKTRRAPKKERSGDSQPYSLRLYITGQTARSLTTVRNVQHVCRDLLAGRFELKVIDIYQQPELAREAQIIAAPTLVKRLPLPLRKLVGDLSNEARVLLALDLKPAPKAVAPTKA
jgi:circadian clock protein KaiB